MTVNGRWARTKGGGLVAQGKILVVDDEIAVRRYLARVLQDYQVELAAGGREGLEWAAKDHFDVALVDIRLPDLDGMEVLRTLQERDQDLKTLIVTAYPALETAIQAVRLGAFDYLLKPLENQKVLISVQNALTARHLALTNQELSRDLQRANVDLEGRIEERTTELADSSEELQGEIAERKRADEALRTSEERYRALFEDVPVGLYRTTPDGEILDANRAAVQMLGYPDRESLLAANAADAYVDPEDRTRWQTLMDREGVVSNFEAPLRRRDGTVIWVGDSARAVRRAEGQVLYYEGTLEDITEQKRAERLLRALNEATVAVEGLLTPEEIFTSVAMELRKLSFACVVLLTDENQKRLSFEYSSHGAGATNAARKVMGLKTEMLSIPIEAVDIFGEVVWERKSVFVENTQQIARQILPGPARRLAAKATRILRVTKAIVAPLVLEDKVIGALLVQSDNLRAEDTPAITAFAHRIAAAWRKADLLRDLQESLEELKRTQGQLLHAQKMEAVGRLAAGVAHDFSNLLTAIMGFGQLLEGALAPDDPRRMDAQEILNAGQRATSLTSQLLAFSRRQVVQPRVLNLNSLVADTEKMLRRLIGEDVDLIIILDATAGWVKADPGQMQQVIMNLAVNARDAMLEAGSLTIRTQNVTLNQEQCALLHQGRPGQFVRLSVMDTGMGMDKETLQHLFEPFFTTREGGTGLGLSVVYGIVQQHEGWMSVQSEPGQGATFRVYLPTFSPTEQKEAQETVPLEELQGHGQGILLVEDDQLVLGVTARMLSDGGYVVFEATTVREALEVFERQRGKIHLLLSDVVLPDGTGLQLADQLLPRKGGLRVLLSSGWSDDKSRWSLARERGFAFVQKPYTWGQVLQSIREVMERSSTTVRAPRATNDL
jgi:PAS domain S-box-containing protein